MLRRVSFRSFADTFAITCIGLKEHLEMPMEYEPGEQLDNSSVAIGPTLWGRSFVSRGMGVSDGLFLHGLSSGEVLTSTTAPWLEIKDACAEWLYETLASLLHIPWTTLHVCASPPSSYPGFQRPSGLFHLGGGDSQRSIPDSEALKGMGQQRVHIGVFFWHCIPSTPTQSQRHVFRKTHSEEKQKGTR